jgi:hypothetical protein
MLATEARATTAGLALVGGWVAMPAFIDARPTTNKPKGVS